MCPYARKKQGSEMLICEPKNQICTLCVLGNAQIYKDIEEKMINKNEEHKTGDV